MPWRKGEVQQIHLKMCILRQDIILARQKNISGFLNISFKRKDSIQSIWNFQYLLRLFLPKVSLTTLEAFDFVRAKIGKLPAQCPGDSIQ